MGWLSSWLYPVICLQLLQSQLISSLSVTSTSSHLCSSDQSSALLRFKQLFSFDELASSSCDGLVPTYPKLMSWNETVDCCSWDGVSCDNVTGYVIGLDLSCSWLQGTIPPNSSLFFLTHLQKLNLAYNDFNSSQISSDFVRFASLEQLNLSSSRFSGQIPPEFSFISKLVSLDLSFNFGLTLGAPVLGRIIQNLTRLEVLKLDTMDMSLTDPSYLKNLSSSLKSLSLLSCSLEGNLPDNIFNLPNLETLRLTANFDLTGIFPLLNWSSPLRVLDVSSTSLTGELPASIGNLKSLQMLNLYDCNFFGSVPSSLGNLTHLTDLDLSHNNFSGQIPFSISNLKQLSRLDFSWNSLIGQIPDIFVNLTRLSGLDLSMNGLSGSIPSSVGELQSLFALYLHDNSLNGTIPSGVFCFPLLTDLDLSNNQLTGPVDEFQYNSLRTIDLSSNRLSGYIPSSIFRLVNLTALSLSWNNFTGSVELFMFAELINLERLNLSHSGLSLGTQTILNSSFSKINSLSLSACNISEFPEMLRTLDQLILLDLSDNNLRGEIPDWTWNMGKDTLYFLNLSYNSLTSVSQIPWKNINYLDLRSNLFEGPLVVPQSNTRFFLISHNKLTGEIPSMICNMSILEVLDLSNNSLTGRILGCMGNISQTLSVLDLRKNRFNGTIPETFANGSNLRTLNLNDNELEGSVPKSLINCKMMQVLDIGNNKINDTFPNWLSTLPELQVLVLHSNEFHGLLPGSETNLSFPKLRILDLSYNNFSGPLPMRFLESLKAMKSIGEGERGLNYLGEEYYQDSVRVTLKGMVVELVRILTVFTTVDWSKNNFHGDIPEVVGDLHALKVLNFSHNSLIGPIPTSLANLTVLESLDLSSNNLSGEIPGLLTSLTFLSRLNLSENQLVGSIPRGYQFDTFENDSYIRNLGLCGWPLSKKCSSDAAPETPSSEPEGDRDSFMDGFGWKAVLIGYGSGVVFGIAVGCVVFITGKPRSLVRIIERKHHRKMRRANQRRRQTRN
ncbi:hypothetical protein PTKIN_Ptkin11bG0193900 [Pterospermum kingtungense]